MTICKSELHSKVRHILCQLSIHQTLEIISVLTNQVSSSALGECSHSQCGHSAIRTLQIEYL